ncbi:MAG TPA: Uma2 family endonuclease [Candidatus Dormibacteraeota bacterium]|jgi:Uma2 family endonuclease
MAQPISDLPVSVEEYLRLEESSAVKHEYVAGEIYALAGASKRHNEIAVNIATRLAAAARGGPCRVYVSDVKLRATEEVFYYPDVMVACDPRGEDPLVEGAPCLVVEVTSLSTEVTDRREKALLYKRIPTLKAYVIVHQDRRRVERHFRDDTGSWRYADAVGEGRVSLPFPEIELTLREIYEGTDVPA